MFARATKAIAVPVRCGYPVDATAARWKRTLCAATKAKLGRAYDITTQKTDFLSSRIGQGCLIAVTFAIDHLIVVFIFARRNAILKTRILATALDHQMSSHIARAERLH